MVTLILDSYIITAQDTLPPTLTIPDDVLEFGDDTSPANTGIATAIDIVSPNTSVTSTDAISPGTPPEVQIITRTWTAIDFSNSASDDQIITAVDTTNPVISNPPDFSTNTDPGQATETVFYTIPTATDSRNT